MGGAIKRENPFYTVEPPVSDHLSLTRVELQELFYQEKSGHILFGENILREIFR